MVLPISAVMLPCGYSGSNKKDKNKNTKKNKVFKDVLEEAKSTALIMDSSNSKVLYRV